jgi:ABC-type nitrate/sulfonate/bicarbonate transport system permease component
MRFASTQHQRVIQSASNWRMDRNVIFAILCIGVVGMLLDWFFSRLQKAVTYSE